MGGGWVGGVVIAGFRVQSANRYTTRPDETRWGVGTWVCKVFRGVKRKAGREMGVGMWECACVAVWVCEGVGVWGCGGAKVWGC